MFNVKKDMSPLSYALQYEMSKKLSKLLYTVDDDIMSVEPLVGDSNYNSIATIKRNGKITRAKYNRKKLDDTLNEVCLAKQSDHRGKVTYTCLTPVAEPIAADNIPDDWDAEKTKEYLKSYELTWNRTMNRIMDTDNNIFNMVGTRNPVGVFDMSRGITKSENDAYLIRNIENTTPYGILTVKYGEQVNIRVPFNVNYSHELFVSNGSLPKSIEGYRHYEINDGRTLSFGGSLGNNGYVSHTWVDSSLLDDLKSVITNDSTVLYTIRYDSNGISVSVTDDVKTTYIDRYETLTDKVFICLAFSYRDSVVSPLSRPEINFTINKQVDNDAPALSTVTFPLARRVATGIVTRDSNGVVDIKPVGLSPGPKECVLNYRCRPGINRLKLTSEIEKAFNSENISEVIVGFTRTGLDPDMSLPYVKFIKEPYGDWQVIRGDRPNQNFTFGYYDLTSVDIVYDSVQRTITAYVKTDPNDNGALDTATPTTQVSTGEQYFNFDPNDTAPYDFSVKFIYNETFDRFPIINATRYTPGPSETKFNFVNAVYTTLGNNCTTHHGSTTYPVNFVRQATYTGNDGGNIGNYRINAAAYGIADNDSFAADINYNTGSVPRKRKIVVTTERLSAADILAGKYQGLVFTYSDVELAYIGDELYAKYNKQSIENTLPAIFTLADVADEDARQNSGVTYIARTLDALSGGYNQHQSYLLLVDMSITEYFVYDVCTDYLNLYNNDAQG